MILTHLWMLPLLCDAYTVKVLWIPIGQQIPYILQDVILVIIKFIQKIDFFKGILPLIIVAGPWYWEFNKHDLRLQTKMNIRVNVFTQQSSLKDLVQMIRFILNLLGLLVNLPTGNFISLCTCVNYFSSWLCWYIRQLLCVKGLTSISQFSILLLTNC